MDVTERLDEILHERKISIFKLTEMSGLSENTIYNWYRGSVPTVYALQCVCEALDITLGEFFMDDKLTVLTLQEKKMLKKFKSFTYEQRKAFLDLAYAFSKT